VPSSTAPRWPSSNPPQDTSEDSNDDHYRARVSEFKPNHRQTSLNWLVHAEPPTTPRSADATISTETFLPAECERASEMRPSGLVRPSNPVCARCSSADCTCSQYSYYESSPVYASQYFQSPGSSRNALKRHYEKEEMLQRGHTREMSLTVDNGIVYKGEGGGDSSNGLFGKKPSRARHF
jgi:hypothetical protein